MNEKKKMFTVRLLRCHVDPTVTALVAQMGGLWSYLYIVFFHFAYRVRHK